MISKFLSVAAALAVVLPAGQVRSASNIDGALDEIASQIVERAAANSRTNVGISTFTHSDGTCSQLSNYVTEFIVDSLFNAGAGQIDIIERSQLSAIFREMELVYDATIAPDTARKLGEIAGVDALVTGSLIEFGEEVKVQARLISTADGKLFATARSEFPRIGTIGKMMEDRSRAACGFTTASGEPEPERSNSTSTGGGDARVQLSADAANTYSSDVFIAELTSVIYAKATGATSFAIRFQNTSENPIGLSYLPKSLSVADGNGGFMTYSGNWSGVRECYNSGSLQYCNTSNPQYATTLPPGKVAQLNFAMEGAEKIEAPRITLSMELVVTPDTSQIDSYDVRSINFLDVTPTIR